MHNILDQIHLKNIVLFSLKKAEGFFKCFMQTTLEPSRAMIFKQPMKYGENEEGEIDDSVMGV